MIDTLSFVEVRQFNRAGGGKWSPWELIGKPVSQRRAKADKDIFITSKRDTWEAWEARVVTFTRSRTYNGERS